jgi:hypothetical protein
VGLLQVRKLVQHQAWGNTGGVGDSTVYKELRQDRTMWVCDQIPLTRLALDQTESTEERRAWLIGRSRDVPSSQPIAKRTVVARIVEYGHGLKSRVLPPDRVHSFDEQPAPKKPAPRPLPRKPAASTTRR